MIKKSYLKLGAFVGSLSAFAMPFIASADTLATKNAGLATIGTNISGGTGTKTLPELIGSFISVILGILGIILVIYIIQAGILYMTAAGDDTKVGKAKKMIQTAIVGMVIIVAAYSIANFVISTLSGVTG